MSRRRSAAITIPFLFILCIIAGCSDEPDAIASRWKDEGVMVYRLGTDTIGYQFFRMDGDSVELKSIYLPGGFSYTRSTGELNRDGSITGLHSIRMVNDSTGNLVLDGQTRINTTGGVSSVDVTGAKPQESIFPGKAYAISDAGPVTSYLLPFWARYATGRDSVNGIHYAFQTSRPFWLLKVTDNLVYAGSDILGKLKIRIDSMNRVLSVDGTESTLHIKGEVSRSMDFDSLLAAVHADPALQSVPPLSPVSKNLYHFADLDVQLNYSQPSKRGRKIFGGIVSYEKPWRMGANRSTEISFCEPVYFNRRKVEPGTYSMFAMMYPDAGMLLLNDHAGIWGTDHEFQWDAFRLPFTIMRLPQPREQLEMRVYPVGDHYQISMEWDDVHATIDFAMAPFGEAED